MPVKSVEVGWEALQDEFHKLMDVAKKKKDHDDIFDQLKGAVVDTAVSKHVWEDKAAEVLKVIQLNTLEDRCARLFEFSTFLHQTSTLFLVSGLCMINSTGTERLNSYPII